MEEQVFVRIDEDWEAGRMYSRIATEEEYEEAKSDGNVVVKMLRREYRMIELATEMFNTTQRYLNDLYEGIVKEEDDEDWVTVVSGKSRITAEQPCMVVHTTKLDAADFRGIPVYEDKD